MKMLRILALPIGFVLDLILGDPSWIRHPVCWIGDLISALEKRLRKIFPDTPGGLLTAGIVMVFMVCAVCYFLPFAILYILYKFVPVAAFLLEILWCYQLLAARSLKQESM